MVKKKIKELKAEISAAGDAESKVAFLTTRCAELVRTAERLAQRNDSLERTSSNASRQRDKLKMELATAVEARKRLEELCRELQRAKQAAIDDRRAAEAAERARADEQAARYKAVLDDIGVKIENQAKDYDRRSREAQLVKSRLVNVMEQYELRTRHFAAIVNAQKAQLEISEAELEQAHANAADFRQKYLDAAQSLIALSNFEKAQQAKLEEYKVQSASLQTMLERTADITRAYQDELNKAQKLYLAADAEKEKWRLESARADVKAIELHTSSERDRKKIAQLEQLCRAMQSQSAASAATMARVKTALSEAAQAGRALAPSEVETIFAEA